MEERRGRPSARRRSESDPPAKPEATPKARVKRGEEEAPRAPRPSSRAKNKARPPAPTTKSALVVEKTEEKKEPLMAAAERRRVAALRGTVTAGLQDRPLSTVAPLPGDRGVLDTARDLLSTDYYARQWGRLAMRSRSEEVDDFGLDPKYEERILPLLDGLYRKWFRVQTSGIENVPSEGPALIVSNHSGTVPLDGAMLKMAIRLEHPSRNELRWLAEDFVFHMPFLGAFMNRIGAVRACQENAERLLSQNRLLAVFPEGQKGIAKLYRQRYQLQRFGRGGCVKLAIRSGAPIVPVAVIGAEEASPLLFSVTPLARAFGLPYLPITPTFPWLGPIGLVPLPTRWRVIFGQPIDLSEYPREAAEDAVLVNRLNERVRGTIQAMIDEGLATRKSIFRG